MDRMTNTTVDTPLAALLTNKRRVSALKALGVLTVADALTYYPFRVTDPVPVRALAEARFGEKMACAVDVRALRVTPMNARRGYRLEVLVDDAPTAASRARRVSALKALGVLTVADALTYYPFRVTDPVPVRALAEARFGEKMACAVDVRALRVTPMNARRGYRLEVLVDDAPTAASRAVPPRTAALVFFSHRKSYVDWMASRLRAGLQLVISGDPSTFNDRLQFTHPDILTVAPAEPPAAEPQLAFSEPAVQPQPRLRYDVDSVAQGLARATRPRPVYHANSRISSEHIHETIDQVLRLLAGEDPFAASPVTADSAQFRSPTCGPNRGAPRSTSCTVRRRSARSMNRSRWPTSSARSSRCATRRRSCASARY